MKKKIVIMGAGEFSREIYSVVFDCIAAGADWEFRGFIDDRLHQLDDFPHEGAMLGAIEAYEPAVDDLVIPAFGDSEVREKYVRILQGKGARFGTLIHPTASVGHHVAIGEGSVLMQFVTVTADAKIGKFVNVGVRSTISHGNKIGDFVSMSSQCCMSGGVTVEDHVFMGTNVTIVPRVTVGRSAYLCAGAVVMKDVNPCRRAMGNPAREYA